MKVRYAISCGHQLTAKAAEDALLAGGNAIDGAVAAFAMSWVVEPCMSGPGGGGYATVIYNGQPISLDFFTQTPICKRDTAELDFQPVEIDFGGATEIYYCGMGSIATPGSVDGLFQLHALGGRIPIPELMRPAIKAAASGHNLDAFQHLDMILLRDIIGRSSAGRQLFFENHDVRHAGTVIEMPELADYMDYLSREGPDAFYQGEVAHRIHQAVYARGGHLTKADLANYSTRIGKPHVVELGGHQVFGNKTSSTGTMILGHLLHGLRNCKSAIECLEQYKAVRSRQEDLIRAFGATKVGGTSHLNVVDAAGNAVSLSMSLGEGSSYFVDGTQIHLNNMLGESALQPAGLHTWRAGSRLNSMMSPCLAVDRAQGSVLSIGSGGSGRIPYVIAQVFHRFVQDENALERHIAAPRVFHDSREWQAEPGFHRPTQIPIDEWNQWSEQNLYFGGVHASVVAPTHVEAVGDSRRNGVAIQAG